MAFDIYKAAKKSTATKLLDKIQSRTPGKRSRAIGVTSGGYNLQTVCGAS